MTEVKNALSVKNIADQYDLFMGLMHTISNPLSCQEIEQRHLLSRFLTDHAIPYLMGLCMAYEKFQLTVWRPIKTISAKGPVLVWGTMKAVPQGSPNCWEVVEKDGLLLTPMTETEIIATHWMPMPEGPKL